MAKQVKAIQIDAKPNYPWDEWCDGSVWEATKGIDFNMPVAAFRNQLYSVASRRGLRVSAQSVDDKTLRFQFRKPSIF